MVGRSNRVILKNCQNSFIEEEVIGFAAPVSSVRVYTCFNGALNVAIGLKGFSYHHKIRQFGSSASHSSQNREVFESCHFFKDFAEYYAVSGTKRGTSFEVREKPHPVEIHAIVFLRRSDEVAEESLVKMFAGILQSP